MLGSIIGNSKWNWAAVGKHPSAKDYIRIGGASPLLDAVGEWSANGYTLLNGNGSRNQQHTHHSWRFWLKGIKKGRLVCGLGRDSSDSIGRPYPLLILGEGALNGWEKQWTELPARLDKTWSRMEFVAAHRFDNASAMEDEINRFNAPEAISHPVTEAAQDGQGNACSFSLDQCKGQLIADGFVMIGLNQAGGVDPYRQVLQCHLRLNECCGEIPRGVFIGGTPQQSYLVVIQHPLNAQDFVKLWTC